MPDQPMGPWGRGLGPRAQGGPCTWKMLLNKEKRNWERKKREKKKREGKGGKEGEKEKGKVKEIVLGQTN